MTLLSALLAAAPAAAVDHTWNGSGSGLWTTAGNWLPSGVPTSTSLVQFTPAAGEVNPSVTGSNAISRLLIGNTPTWGNWTFSGGGSLVAHGGTSGFVVSGLGTTTLDGVSLAGSGTAADIRLGYGNGLSLVNSASATTLIGGTASGINLAGGTLTIDRSAGGTANLAVSDSTVPVSLGGGTLIVKAAASGASTFSIGGNLQANAQPGTIWLANNASGRTSVSFDTLSRAGTRFVVESGTLGGPAATDPRVTFTTTPPLFNGILAQNNNTTGSNGYAIISNPAGTQAAFANYVATGIAAATTTAVSGNLSSSDSANARLTAGGSVASSTTVNYNSLTIEPSAAGQSLSINSGGVIGGNSLPVLLTGSHDFSITGGVFGNSGNTHYMWVSNPAQTLTIASNLQTGFFVKLGPGTLALTGTLTNMFTKGLSAAEGVLRVTSANLGMTSDDPGVVFQGTGVLEYDLTTGSGDVNFTKTLSNNAASSAFPNVVSWTLTRVDATDFSAPRGGSGGFSAMSTNANSRNLVIAIGGTSSPTLLTWGGTSGFVRDGLALKFGSPTSTNTVVWKNAIALDSGSPTTYEARVIEVTAGTAGAAADLTQIDGVITGSAVTELVKTGSGRLVLNAANTYAGPTTIAAGTLALGSAGSFADSTAIRVGGAGSSGAVLDLTAKTGTFTFGSGQTVRGIGTIKPGTVEFTGILAPGNSAGILTFDGGTALLSGTTQIEIFGATRGTGYDAIDLMNSAGIDYGNGVLALDFGSWLADQQSYQLFGNGSQSLLGDFSSVTITGTNYTGLTFTGSGGVWTSQGTSASGQTLTFTESTGTLVIVPEPGGLALAGVCIAAAAAAARLIRGGRGPKRPPAAPER